MYTHIHIYKLLLNKKNIIFIFILIIISEMTEEKTELNITSNI